jgi:uncharacterized membrane protein YfcA
MANDAQYIFIALTAFAGAGLTFFSGFGLGTLLTPVFAIFFPLEVAVALTAIVHLLNNLFKLYLVGNQANKSIVKIFGIPSVLAAFAGAYCLERLGNHHQPLFTHILFGKTCDVTVLGIVMGILLVIFALFEILPSLSKLSFDKRFLPVGGLLSGFFGGLSGHQGALRSAFLMKLGLEKNVFIGTGVAIACLIDFSRLTVYFNKSTHLTNLSHLGILTTATFSAFAGAYLGNKFLKKMTISTLQYIVAGALMLFGLGLIVGIIGK